MKKGQVNLYFEIPKTRLKNLWKIYNKPVAWPLWRKWVGVRMTQQQNDTVRHFGTATKWHGVLMISYYFYKLVKKSMINT